MANRIFDDDIKLAPILRCSAANIAAIWPIVQAQMQLRDCYSDFAAISALATIKVETGIFAPIPEYGGDNYFFNMYDINGKRPLVAKKLGNLDPGDGIKYHGRGLIQLTGKSNYETASKAIGIDLIADPDKALEPLTAATLFAWYWQQHAITAAADAQDWTLVRQKVNGGLNGYPDFLDYVQKLVAYRNAAPQEVI